MRRTADSITLAVLAIAVVVAKAPAFGTPAYWDEMGWLGQAYALADGSLIQALPGFRPAQAFVGHPPGLHVMFALAAKVFGASVVTAHVLSTAYAVAGVCFTYLLGALLFDRWTARLAALLLAISPMYFAQAGMFLADVPAAALAAGSVYFALSGRRIAYVVCGSAMVLTKETAAAIVAALLIYDVVLRKPRVPIASSTFAIHAAPLFALGAFFTWQKLATGSWWLTYSSNSSFDLSWLRTTFAMVRHEARRISDWLFVAQSRSVLTVVMAISIAARFGQWRRREIWLLALVVLMGAYPFMLTGQFFLPRYLLPTLPFFYLLGAWASMALLRGRAWQLIAGVTISAVMIVSLFRQPFFGTGELDLRYRDVVRTHQDIATAIARDFPGARVLTVWPHTSELVTPRFGYVARAMNVVPVTMAADRTPTDLDRDLTHADLVWVTPVPASPGTSELRAHAIAAGWHLVQRVVRDPVVSELYAR